MDGVEGGLALVIVCSASVPLGADGAAWAVIAVRVPMAAKALAPMAAATLRTVVMCCAAMGMDLALCVR